MADTGATGGDPTALRAEHDALAEKLQVRRSVDEMRRFAYHGFGAVLSLGLTLKFAWDRWGRSLPRPPVRGRYPLLVAAALLLFVGLALRALGAWLRARALRREEEPMYARFRELRKTLRLDP